MIYVADFAICVLCVASIFNSLAIRKIRQRPVKTIVIVHRIPEDRA